MRTTIKNIHTLTKPLLNDFRKQLTKTYFIIIPAMLITAFLDASQFNAKMIGFFLTFPIIAASIVIPIILISDSAKINLDAEEKSISSHSRFIHNRFNKLN